MSDLYMTQFDADRIALYFLMPQVIFIPYGITEDDEADGIRKGGFGSTNS